jgi:V/A-type H+-transporting ATPase subunit A
MPGEEGYPAYLATRLASFYERSGRVEAMGDGTGETRVGSVTMVGAVSPPGGDMSEPMTQNSLRVSGAFWALDTSLAHRRHFPAISWLSSYTLYLNQVGAWFAEGVAQDWAALREKAMQILQKEVELQEIVQLVGPDALPESEKLTLEAARMLREDFLQQFAFDEVDAHCAPKKQYWMLKAILAYYDAAVTALGRGAGLTEILGVAVRDDIAGMKTMAVPADDPVAIKEIIARVDEQLKKVEVV